MRRLAGTLAAIVLLAGCGGEGDEDGGAGPAERETTAWVRCERFLEQRMGEGLDFGDRDETEISGQAGGPYTVKGTVDGGPYSCRIEHDPESDEWRLIELDVER
jgi:hypothetical protein